MDLKMNQVHEPCEIKQEGKLYKIGMFAGINHVTIKALRYYDEQNLLKPAKVDEESGYRLSLIHIYIRINSPLPQEVNTIQLTCFFFEHTNKLTTNNFTFLFLSLIHI